ncbi:MAG: pyruvate dehydrogenase (acetyl-transferring) E1 component subunit alpha, partial [Streptomyces sp.]
MTVESTAARGKPRRSDPGAKRATKKTASAQSDAGGTNGTTGKSSAASRKPASKAVGKTAGKTATAGAKGGKGGTRRADAPAASAATAGTELVQLLTPEGERVEHPDYAIDLPAEELRGLYRDMVLTRRFDAEAT